MTDLPPGFTPAWEYLRTEDGVVELEHEGGRIAREAMEAAMRDTTSHDEIVRNADAMQRGIDGATGAFERCRKAGSDLAAAIRNLPESEVKTALCPAYETYMSLDSGNFHEIADTSPCPQGRTDYAECMAPFRYCPVKGCGRAEDGRQL